MHHNMESPVKSTGVEVPQRQVGRADHSRLGTLCRYRKESLNNVSIVCVSLCLLNIGLTRALFSHLCNFRGTFQPSLLQDFNFFLLAK